MSVVSLFLRSVPKCTNHGTCIQMWCIYMCICKPIHLRMLEKDIGCPVLFLEMVFNWTWSLSGSQQTLAIFFVLTPHHIVVTGMLMWFDLNSDFHAWTWNTLTHLSPSLSCLYVWVFEYLFLFFNFFYDTGSYCVVMAGLELIDRPGLPQAPRDLHAFTSWVLGLNISFMPS